MKGVYVTMLAAVLAVEGYTAYTVSRPSYTLMMAVANNELDVINHGVLVAVAGFNSLEACNTLKDVLKKYELNGRYISKFSYGQMQCINMSTGLAQ